MIFNSKVIMKSQKEHRCSMCIGLIQKGNPYVAVPYKDGAEFKDIQRWWIHRHQHPQQTAEDPQRIPQRPHRRMG